MRLPLVLPVIAASALALSAASTASAEDAGGGFSASAGASVSPAPGAAVAPETVHRISVAGLLGYGFNNISADDSFSVNIYGLGVGARGGSTLPMNVYVGGLAQYNLGSSTTVPSPEGNGVVGTISARVLVIGPEVGYELPIEQFTIRPYLGLGTGVITGEGPFVSDNSIKLAFWPGVVGVYNITDRAFAGLDVRYTLLFADTAGGGSPNSLGFYGTGGYRF